MPSSPIKLQAIFPDCVCWCDILSTTASSHRQPLLLLLLSGMCQAGSMQDNDVERETTLNRDHLDYLVEESWRWLLSCEFALHTVPGFCTWKLRGSPQHRFRCDCKRREAAVFLSKSTCQLLFQKAHVCMQCASTAMQWKAAIVTVSAPNAPPSVTQAAKLLVLECMSPFAKQVCIFWE